MSAARPACRDTKSEQEDKLPDFSSGGRVAPTTILKPWDFYFSPEDAEAVEGYQLGGYHPVHLGERYEGKGRYKILHKLGWGSYSTVWLARDLTSIKNRYVALKFLVAEIQKDIKNGGDVSECPNRVSESLNEIQILHHLNAISSPFSHPGGTHILSLLDHFVVSGPNGIHRVLVTEVTGPRITLLPKPRDVVRDVCRQIMQGVDYLHQRGIGHGDLHAGNVVVEMPHLSDQPEGKMFTWLKGPSCCPVITKDLAPQGPSLPRYLVTPASFETRIRQMVDDGSFRWNVKLIDFGDAFFTNARPAQLNTPLVFRAPEAVFYERSSGEIESDWNLRVDIWSLGCLIFRLITGDTLFPQYFDSEEELISDWAWTLGPLPARWLPYCGPSVPHFTSEGMMIDRPEDDDLTLEQKIHNRFRQSPGAIAGSPDDLIDLLRQMLVFEPGKRKMARELLAHRWFESS